MAFPVRYDNSPTVKATKGRPPASGPRPGTVALTAVILEVSDQYRAGGIYNPRPIRTSSGNGSIWSCLAGETEVITPDGPVPISELAGRTVPVLTRINEPDGFDTGGRSIWRDAPIKNYGKRPLMRVVLAMRGAEREVFATANHRWYVAHRSSRYVSGRDRFAYRYDTATTDGLEIGALVPKQRPNMHSRLNPSAVGIAHGIVSGDGHLANDGKRFNGPAFVTLWGDKVELLEYFHPSAVAGTASRESGIVGTVLAGLPREWKSTPKLTESTSYLAGWWAGMIAADGTVSKRDGALSWSTSSEDDLATMLAVCERVGVGHGEPRLVKGSGYSGDEAYWHQLNFTADTVPESLIIRSHHRDNFAGRRGGGRKNEFWKVVSVDETDRVEDVFCAEVPESQCFTLGGHILTGNTHANGSATDIMIAVNRSKWPDGNPIGWELADALVAAHAELGIQQVIWAKKSWRASRGWRNLSSRSLDHMDHLHIEQTTQAATLLTRDDAKKWLGVATGPSRVMLQLGDKSPWVTEVRLWLGEGDSPVFDQRLTDAAMAFQQSKHLGVDGVVGPATWQALRSDPQRIHAAVHNVYQTVLGRNADLGGLGHWATLIGGGMTLLDMVKALRDSDEYLRAAINRSYAKVLDRPAGQAAFDYWPDVLRGGASIDDLEQTLRVSDEYDDLQRQKRKREAEAKAPPPTPPASPPEPAPTPSAPPAPAAKSEIVDAITALLRELVK